MNLKDLPKSVTNLTLDDYKRDINGPIPNFVTMLTFDGDSDIPEGKGLLQNGKASVTHLTFGCFNSDIKGLIPNLVTHLSFEISFNRKIKDSIPNSVTHLSFGYFFNQDISLLPKNLIELSLGVRFKQKKLYSFPQSLRCLRLKKNTSIQFVPHKNLTVYRHDGKRRVRTDKG